MVWSMTAGMTRGGGIRWLGWLVPWHHEIVQCLPRLFGEGAVADLLGEGQRADEVEPCAVRLAQISMHAGPDGERPPLGLPIAVFARRGEGLAEPGQRLPVPVIGG